MFVGSLPKYALDYLVTNVARQMAGHRLVVGCSGNFTIERAVAHAQPDIQGIYSNDVSLYSCTLGWWLTGDRDHEITMRDEAPIWMRREWRPGATAVACLDVMLEALQYEAQKNSHQARMWDAYRLHFGEMVDARQRSLADWTKPLTGFWAGDVAEHFRQHDDDKSVFVCFAPTYVGGYERQYKRLDALFDWPRPEYQKFDKKRAAALFGWMQDRRYAWFGDCKIDGLQPAMLFRRGGMKTIYLYTNLEHTPGYISPTRPQHAPILRLANAQTRLCPSTNVQLIQILTSELCTYKDMFLSKKIDHKPGQWALAVVADGEVVGFVEYAYKQEYGQQDSIYLNSDFPVSGTVYPRLSKLIAMMAVCGDARRFLERRREMKQRELRTTAFTDKPISMKYRGVLEVEKRGEHDGRKYINYVGTFNDESAGEVYMKWLKKHGSTN